MLSKSSNRRLSQTTSFVTEQRDKNLASVVDVAVTVCFFELYAIGPELAKHTQPEVLSLLSTSPAKSASLYAISVVSREP